MADVLLEGIDLARLGDLAEQITRRFPRRLVIGLVGTLGAGKTTFTQALADAADVDPEDVTSPTFTLLCSYDANVAAGPIRLHHLDAYRIADEDEFLELGVEELFDAPSSWVLIEWADRVQSVMPRETLWLHIDMEESDGQDAPSRVIRLHTEDVNLAEHLDELAKSMQA